MSSKKTKTKEQNNKLVMAVIAILVLGVMAYVLLPKFHAEEKNMATVQNLVETFGKRLQNVNLAQKDQDTLSLSIEENYGKLVENPLMLVNWLRNPANAPGRLTSSPWPDHIEILSTSKLSDTKYEVNGNIVEITKDDLSENCTGVAGVDTEIEGCELTGFALKRPISITVEKTNHKGNPWLMTEVTLGQYTISGSGETPWQTTINEGQNFTYEYPSSLDSKFVKIKNLPPEVTATKNINSRLTCNTTKEGADLDKSVVKETINENVYCITTEKEDNDEGLVKNYSYETVNDDFGLIAVNLAINYQNCDDLESKEKQECLDEEKKFDLNSIVDKIVASLKSN